ncbi:unnamed protein product, partial [Mesocestoides corti]|uniref:Uridylate-specific endoribonuclease n=1 Tax=Mesocestoides corti TaxID=53468 RepID=A0A0R3UBH1_MESCO
FCKVFIVLQGYNDNARCFEIPRRTFSGDDAKITAVFSKYFSENILRSDNYVALEKEVITILKSSPIFSLSLDLLNSIPGNGTRSAKDLLDDVLLAWVGMTAGDILEDVKPLRHCAFEHVFIGKFIGDKLTGLHAWQRFFILERDNRLRVIHFYKKHRCLNLAAMRFVLDGKLRLCSSIFFGLPMDFELMIFFVILRTKKRRVTTSVLLANEAVQISCFPLAYDDKVISSAYFLS